MARKVHEGALVLRRCALARSRSRGFTLLELMSVVAIVGVLATIGVVSYRKFVTSAKTSEAMYMVGAIRSAEESYRAETLTYLDVSTSNTFYPMTSPSNVKYAWDQTHTDATAWAQLGVRSDGPVYYGYKCRAGTAGGTPPALSELASPPTWPNPTTDAWYVIEAAGDVDNNGIRSYVVGSSFTGELYVENQGE